jgi:hypothetical protein
MAQPHQNKKYFFNTDTFIDIVHELEELPVRPRVRNDSVITSITRAEIEIWQNLFNLPADDARHLIGMHREPAENKRTIPVEILQDWP